LQTVNPQCDFVKPLMRIWSRPTWSRAGALGGFGDAARVEGLYLAAEASKRLDPAGDVISQHRRGEHP
jgi:hypothetical protein